MADTELDKARDAFAEVLEVLDKLTPHVDSLDDLVGMLRLAVGHEGTPGNDGQAKLLLGLIRNRKK